MTTLVVGGRFPIKVTGQCLFRIFCGLPMLIYNFPAPTKIEIASIDHGNIAVSLYECGNTLFFLSSFGNLPWSDTPCNANQNSEDELQEFFLKAHRLEDKIELGLPLSVILLDSNTGVIKAMRYFGLSNQFSMRLIEIFRRQFSTEYDEKTELKKIRNLYQRISSEEMASMAQERFILKK